MKTTQRGICKESPRREAGKKNHTQRSTCEEARAKKHARRTGAKKPVRRSKREEALAKKQGKKFKYSNIETFLNTNVPTIKN